MTDLPRLRTQLVDRLNITHEFVEYVCSNQVLIKQIGEKNSTKLGSIIPEYSITGDLVDHLETHKCKWEWFDYIDSTKIVFILTVESSVYGVYVDFRQEIEIA